MEELSARVKSGDPNITTRQTVSLHHATALEYKDRYLVALVEAMEAWYERGRPALFNALETICNQIGTDLQTEIEANYRPRDKDAAAQLQDLHTRVAKVDALEEENLKLRNQLIELRHESRSEVSTEPLSAATTSKAKNGGVGETSDNSDAATEEINKLRARYNALDANWRALKAGYIKKKEEAERWKIQAASLRSNIESLKRENKALASLQEPISAAILPPVVPPNQRSRASSHEPSGPLQPDLASSLSFSSEPGPDLAARDENDEAGTRGSPLLDSRDLPRSSGVTASTQSEASQDKGPTSGDAVNLPPLPATDNKTASVYIKAEPSSEGPVFVGERSVRKRKPDDAPDSPPRRRVKLETGSSEETTTVRRVNFAPSDGLDLDDVGQKLATPKKHRNAAGVIIHMPGSGNRLVISKDDNAGDVSTVTPRTRPVPESSALTPINPNLRIPRPQVSKTAEKPKQARKGLFEGISSLAEDGNLYQRAVRRKTNDVMEGNRGEGRLDRLLNTPVRDEAPRVVRSTGRKIVRAEPEPEPEPGMGPKRRQLPFGAGSRASENAHVGTPTRTIPREPKAKPQGKPDSVTKPRTQQAPEAAPKGQLRLKSVDQLRLDDFKINPRFNDGSDFAYTEVVRGKADRSCLAGCTDLSCCGKQFRAMAKAQRERMEPSHQEDMKLFQDYLGDSISRFWGMSLEEKEELWLEAKTWQLANQHGKHRHRHARQPSPPGFWDLGFPNTQELQQEKKEAEKRERQTIQDRYREAMRPEGRWLFRDE